MVSLLLGYTPYDGIAVASVTVHERPVDEPGRPV
jgi:hypothetical protein